MSFITFRHCNCIATAKGSAKYKQNFTEEDVRAITAVPGEENSIHIEDINIPRINETGALVKVKPVGTEGTDWKIIKGLHGKPSEGKRVYFRA